MIHLVTPQLVYKQTDSLLMGKNTPTFSHLAGATLISPYNHQKPISASKPTNWASDLQGANWKTSLTARDNTLESSHLSG